MVTNGLILAISMVLFIASCGSGPETDPDSDLGADTNADLGAPDGGERLDAQSRDGAIPDQSPPLVEPAWIHVAAGTFNMGSPANESCRRDDEDLHPVTISRDFDLAETEVTQDQFASAMGYNPSFHSACGASCPVDWVSWHEAAAYCVALSAAKGLPACYACTGEAPSVTCEPAPGSVLECIGFRLPTEAEFEYAARAGSATALPNGEITSCMSTDKNAEAIAWYKVNSTGLPRPVKGKSANQWGLFDLTGNAYEWVHDWYEPKLGASPVKDPTGPAKGNSRVFRGGAWYFNAEHLRPAHRLSFSPAKRFTYLGFRCARTR